jgi:hypothetical protein
MEKENRFSNQPAKETPMNQFRLFLIALALTFGMAAVPLHSTWTAAASSSKKKTVHVRSYTRKDGTVVRAHDRSAPGTKKYSSPRSSAPKGSKAVRCATCPRDSHGKIARSASAKHEFMRQSGYPHGRPGYVVDHIKPLACGGADAPSNMMWQTKAEAREKDKTELRCK